MVRVYLGRDPITGKRKDYNKVIHGTKKDAQAYLNKLLTQRDMGTLVEQSMKSLNQYLDQWLEQAAKMRVRARTYSDYEKLLERYVRPVLGYKPIAKITPLEIQSLYNSLQDRNLSPRTIRYTHCVLRSALQQAMKWQILSQNPADRVDLPRLVRKEMQALSPTEATGFLKEAKDDRWALLFSLALATGMRPGEYLALQWKDVDLRGGSLTVKRALVRLKGGWRFEEPKTARSRRSIPLPATLLQALSEYRRSQVENILVMGPKYQNHDLVFANEYGEPLHIRNLERHHFKPILKKAGIPETFRLYDLRHTCATLLLAAGVNPKIVAERLGHASVTLTLDTYSHVLPDMQKQATQQLETILYGS